MDPSKLKTSTHPSQFAMPMTPAPFPKTPPRTSNLPDEIGSPSLQSISFQSPVFHTPARGDATSLVEATAALSVQTSPPGSEYNPHFIYVDMDRFERNKPFFTLLVKEARCGNQVILHISIIA